MLLTGCVDTLVASMGWPSWTLRASGLGRDLFEAIESGAFPAWELAVQLFAQEQADALPYDHLDPTRIIPEEVVPLLQGRLFSYLDTQLLRLGGPNFAQLPAVPVQDILKAAGVQPDAGVFGLDDVQAFLEGAKRRYWDREPTLRTLA